MNNTDIVGFLTFMLVAGTILIFGLSKLFKSVRNARFQGLQDAQLYDLLNKSKLQTEVKAAKNEIRRRNLQLPPEPDTILLPKKTTIEKIVLKITTTDEIKWPTRCPCCGNSLNEQDTQKFDIKIEGFTFSTLKPVQLGFCNNCCKEFSKPKKKAIENTIVFGLGYTFYAGYFLMKQYWLSVPYILGKTLGVWLVLGLWFFESAKDKKRKLLGLRIKKIGKDSFSIWIKSESFAKYFMDENSAVMMPKEVDKKL